LRRFRKLFPRKRRRLAGRPPGDQQAVPAAWPVRVPKVVDRPRLVRVLVGCEAVMQAAEEASD